MRRALVIFVACSLGCAAPPPRPAPVAASPAEAPVQPDPRATTLVTLPGGAYRPMFPGKDEPQTVDVSGFRLEERAVTNAQFLAFVTAEPRWRRSAVKSLFADAGYLRHWSGDLSLPRELAERPVTNVSWFAARAYARWIGRRLPSLAEWEYAAAASETSPDGTREPAFQQRILAWYSRPSSTPDPAGGVFRNLYGVLDLHGVVWEWVDDFNTALVTGESRGDAGLDRGLFCGSGSVGAADPSDYAAFMRAAFRSSLRASYTVKNLGFRCAAKREESP